MNRYADMGLHRVVGCARERTAGIGSTMRMTGHPPSLVGAMATKADPYGNPNSVWAKLSDAVTGSRLDPAELWGYGDEPPPGSGWTSDDWAMWVQGFIQGSVKNGVALGAIGVTLGTLGTLAALRYMGNR